MTQTNSGWPIPQLGAVLRYAGPNEDGRIPRGALCGSDHWFLVGSASLIGNDRVLSIWHVVKREPLAVFFPWIGLIPIRSIDRQAMRWEDSIVLLGLEKQVARIPPLAFRWPILRRARHAWVGGYGRWHDAPGAPGLYGLQHLERVNTTYPDHKLDMAWRPVDNNGVSAGPFNSGGPMMYRREAQPYEVVAVNRSGFGPMVRASRIARERWWWLRWRVVCPRGGRCCQGSSAAMPTSN